MSEKDLISAAPGFNSDSPSTYFYKPELSSTSAASKEALSSNLKPKQGLYVAPHHKEALKDQAQRIPDKPEPVPDSTVTIINQSWFQGVSQQQADRRQMPDFCLWKSHCPDNGTADQEWLASSAQPESELQQTWSRWNASPSWGAVA